MNEIRIVDDLCSALRDDRWHMLEVTDDRGNMQQLNRLEVIDYLACLAPELAIPPSQLH